MYLDNITECDWLMENSEMSCIQKFDSQTEPEIFHVNMRTSCSIRHRIRNQKCDEWNRMPPWRRVLTHHAIRALLRLRLIIQTSLLGSYTRKSAWSTWRVNIGTPASCSAIRDRIRNETYTLSSERSGLLLIRPMTVA